MLTAIPESRHVKLYGVQLFAVWFEFARQMSPSCVVQEGIGSVTCRGLKVVNCVTRGTVTTHFFTCCRMYRLAKVHFVTDLHFTDRQTDRQMITADHTAYYNRLKLRVYG